MCSVPLLNQCIFAHCNRFEIDCFNYISAYLIYDTVTGDLYFRFVRMICIFRMFLIHKISWLHYVNGLN